MNENEAAAVRETSQQVTQSSSITLQKLSKPVTIRIKKSLKHLTGRRQLWFNMELDSARNFKIQTWRFQGFPFQLKWRSKGMAELNTPSSGVCKFEDGPSKLHETKLHKASFFFLH